ncbi:MAG: TRAP transporter large permease subunit [Desulfobacterales bacterium]|nr:TRAP transporter large permease subunit [Desulfobacterales bacterium]
MFGYIFIAPYLGGVWQMRGLSWRFLFNSIYYSPLGIYGSVTGMSATFIAMFVVFGALLSVSILSPALLKLGVDVVAAHLFFIYWGVLGAITPPTCEAAVVAAGISKGDWMKTGLEAMKLGAVAFCVPYFMVIHPALAARGAPGDIVFAAVTGFIGALTMAYGLFGWKDSDFNIPLRGLFFIGGALLLFPGFTLSLSGFGLTVVALVLNKLITPRALVSA